MHSKDERNELFWCKLLDAVIFNEIDKAEINRYLREICKKEYVFPDGKHKKPSLSTLRRKLNKFKAGGFKNLARKKRSDRGKIRTCSQEVLQKAIELKKEQPYRSDDAINRFLEIEYGKTIPKSTLYRHLKHANATKLKLGITKKKVRKRWTREHTHDLWVGDFQEGPYVLVGDEVLPTYLCLFIDCHSRYVVEGRYYLSQKLDVLIDSLLRAWSIHGKSKELYVDNAKIYLSNALKAACYNLCIKLLHRPPGDPPPGGLVEKFFGTNQGQFEAEVRAGDILKFNKLNQAFSAYLNVAYHPRVHTETGKSPNELYKQSLTVIRHVDMNAAIEFFMKKEERTVHKDFSDIQLDNRFYRVDKKLRGDKVQVRYDPFSDMYKVFIYSPHDQYLGEGKLYNRDVGDETQEVVSTAKPKNNYIELLIQEHDKQLNTKSKGIDYRNLVSKRTWPFAAFIQKLAKLMGRKGSIGAFNAEELETLKKAYNRIPQISESMLVEAFKMALEKTILHIIYQLQIIKNTKEKK